MEGGCETVLISSHDNGCSTKLTSCSIATVDDYESGLDVNIVRERFAESARKGENNRVVVWAGSGVGLMSKILPAKVLLDSKATYRCIEFFLIHRTL